MHKNLIALIAVLCSIHVQAQKIDSSYNNTYYQGRMELFNSLQIPHSAIVFLGNSITERGMWHELLSGKPIVNRGIGGDNTFGVLARIQPVIDAKPKKVFLLIGVNDISRNLPVEVTAANYEKIIQRFKKGSPKTTLYVQSVFPVNDAILKAEYIKNKGHLIIELNKRIKALAAQYNVPFIELYSLFNDGQGNLLPEMTNDGIHLRPAAYVKWVDFLKRNKYL